MEVLQLQGLESEYECGYNQTQMIIKPLSFEREQLFQFIAQAARRPIIAIVWCMCIVTVVWQVQKLPLMGWYGAASSGTMTLASKSIKKYWTPGTVEKLIYTTKTLVDRFNFGNQNQSGGTIFAAKIGPPPDRGDRDTTISIFAAR